MDVTQMKHVSELLNRHPGRAASTIRALAAAGLLAVLMVSGGSAANAANTGDSNDGVRPCATVEASSATGDNTLVASRPEDLIIIIRPSAPKVGRPVIAWISGHQPGHLLVARRISWAFNNAASMLKDSGGGSASTIYLTPGKKTISVSVTDMSGKRKKATCSLNVTW